MCVKCATLHERVCHLSNGCGSKVEGSAPVVGSRLMDEIWSQFTQLLFSFFGINLHLIPPRYLCQPFKWKENCESGSYKNAVERYSMQRECT